MADQFQGDARSSEGIWEKLSQIAIMGAAYDSRERQPHPKCLQGTRVVLLNHIYELSDNREQGSRLIWLHGTAGVGKSAVAFTVAERMRGLTMTGQKTKEKRLAGSFFFSRRHTKRCTTGYFFATLAYQLARNFPSVREEVIRAIREDPAVLDPDASLHDQMEALFLSPLRRLRLRLRDCPPLAFVVDALDECISKTEVADLISLLGQALHDPDLPVIDILLTSRSESHISEAIQEESVRPLVCEIPVKISGEGVATTISLDGVDVDNDIYIFLDHSFTKLHNRCSKFPRPTKDELARLASRAGRRFIVASTMMKFIDDGHNDPRGRLQLMLELTSKLLPGTEVYKLYNCILSTCSDPERAYQHLSVVAALADPLPMSQISELLGPGQGRDVEAALVQLRSVMEIPTDNSLPVTIYHSSIRDYISDPSNCSLPQVRHITPPHSVLALSSFHLMIQDILESTALLDALSELKKQSQAMQAHDPQSLKDSLAFIVQPPEPLHILMGLLWLRGDRSADLHSWLTTLDGSAWLQTKTGNDWLFTREGFTWLQTQEGLDWEEAWVQSLQRIQAQDAGKRESLKPHNKRSFLESLSGGQQEETQNKRRFLENERERGQVGDDSRPQWMKTKAGQEWLQMSGMVQIKGRFWSRPARDWLQTDGGREWLQTDGGREWLQMYGDSGKAWLRTDGGRKWLRTDGGREWLRTEGGQGQDWLQTLAGQGWLETHAGQEWLQTEGGQDWLQTRSGRQWLTLGEHEWLPTLGGQQWLLTLGGHQWLPTLGGQQWLQTQDGRQWLQTQSGREWLQTQSGREWLQTANGQAWQLTPAAALWVSMEEFTATFESISDYTIVPELPTFEVIQHFQSLPDFLMFPVFLALRHQDHHQSSTSTLPQGRYPPVIHVMKAFSNFANDARQSSSDALKYACHNWAFHLSRAPNPWDDTLNHIFKSFWDRNLLSWLERQWCLKGLRSCLIILSEGQKLAQEHLHAPRSSQTIRSRHF